MARLFDDFVVIDFHTKKSYNLQTKKIGSGQSSHDLDYIKFDLDDDLQTDVFRYFRYKVGQIEIGRSDTSDVVEMIDVFTEYGHTLKNRPLKEYILMDGIVKTCFRLQVEDSIVVARLFAIMFSCWETFGPLHFRGTLRPVRLLKKEKNAYKRLRRNNVKTYSYLAYFLHHAKVEKLFFGGRRMIDFSVYGREFKAPIIMAANAWCSKAVLTYLQYGACLEGLEIDESRSNTGVNCALTDILRVLIQYIYYRIVRPALVTEMNVWAIRRFCDSIDPLDKELCMTLNYILRAIRQVDYGSMNFNINYFSMGEDELLVNGKDVVKHPVFRVLIPVFENRYQVPIELKHACRWTIRKRLNENWQLPDGIKNLPLPKPMKSYLNLLKD